MSTSTMRHVTFSTSERVMQQVHQELRKLRPSDIIGVGRTLTTFLSTSATLPAEGFLKKDEGNWAKEIYSRISKSARGINISNYQ